MTDGAEMPRVQLPHDLQRLLFVSWMLRYATEAGFENRYGSVESMSTIGHPAGRSLKLEWLDSAPWVNMVASHGSDSEIASAWHRAAALAVENSDFGGDVWYSTSVETSELDMQALVGQMMRLLGDQTRIVGWRRLGSNILLEFEEQPSSHGGDPFAPATTIQVHIATPGPVAGPFSASVAHNVADVVSTVCSFALGRHVTPPVTTFPTHAGAVSSLDDHRTDPAILTLARQGVSLDLFDDLTSRAGEQGHAKARAAFMTFDAALQQEREQVATLLFVACAECLTNPMQPWRTERITKRFVSFFEEAIPDQLDEIAQHPSFEKAFDLRLGNRSPRARRRQLLKRLYALRSAPVHEGLANQYKGFFDDLGSEGAIRRALASEFAQAAVLAYLVSPRSSLIGHPGITASQ